MSTSASLISIKPNSVRPRVCPRSVAHQRTYTRGSRQKEKRARAWGGGRVWHEAMELVCLLLAAPIGLSPWFIPTPSVALNGFWLWSEGGGGGMG